jgi:outer membrane protein TolC
MKIDSSTRQLPGRLPIREILIAAGLMIAGCGQTPPGIFDPVMLQHPEVEAAGQVPLPDMRPLPTTREDIQEMLNPATTRPTTGRSLESRPVIRMSLQEIIHRAVANSPDVKIAAYQPAIDGTKVTEAAAHFDPTFFSNFTWTRKDEENGGVLFNDFTTGGTTLAGTNRSEVGDLQIGISQNLDSGGQIQIQAENQINWGKPATAQENPLYAGLLSLQLTQPLLKNFGYNVNHAQITINRDTQKVSLLEFRKALEKTCSDLEKTYWQSVQIERDIKSQEELVSQTEQTYNVLYIRYKNLDVSALQVAQAERELDTQRSQLVRFRSNRDDLSDQLKALMGDPEFPIMGDVVILPADAPLQDPIIFDLQDQVDTALKNRFELGEQQLRIDSAIVTVEVAKNNLLPEFDLIGSVGPQGAAAGELNAIQRQWDLQHWDYSIGFKFQIPFGNRAARAIYERSRYQQLQALAQYQSLINQVTLDVKTSAREVTTAWDILVDAHKSVMAAESTVNNIEQEEKTIAKLTPEFVQLKLDLLTNLAQSRQSEAEALANYNIAISALEQAKGTLLKYDNVLMQEEPVTGPDSNILR